MKPAPNRRFVNTTPYQNVYGWVVKASFCVRGYKRLAVVEMGFGSTEGVFLTWNCLDLIYRVRERKWHYCLAAYFAQLMAIL